MYICIYLFIYSFFLFIYECACSVYFWSEIGIITNVSSTAECDNIYTGYEQSTLHDRDEAVATLHRKVPFLNVYIWLYDS